MLAPGLTSPSCSFEENPIGAARDQTAHFVLLKKYDFSWKIRLLSSLVVGISLIFIMIATVLRLLSSLVV